MSWYFRAILNSLGWLPKRPAPQSRQIDHWYSPELLQRIVEQIRLADPDIILFEYLTQTQVLRALPDSLRRSTVMVLDSHDILWKRNQAFQQRGEEHWLDIDRQQEEAALREFDLVIAIQPSERDYFVSVVGESRVIETAMEMEGSVLDAQGLHPERSETADHGTGPMLGDFKGPSKQGLPDQITGREARLGEGATKPDIRVGFLGSDNRPNQDCLRRILDLWPKLFKRNPRLRLSLAGSICDRIELLEPFRSLEGVEILGRLESLEDFYCRLQVVWNPVTFGTGLKIKNLEALAHGVGLVTTCHGVEGFAEPGNDREAPSGAGILLAETDEELLDLFSGLDLDLSERLGQEGIEFVRKRFGKGTQYPALRRKLRALFSEKSL